MYVSKKKYNLKYIFTQVKGVVEWSVKYKNLSCLSNVSTNYNKIFASVMFQNL